MSDNKIKGFDLDKSKNKFKGFLTKKSISTDVSAQVVTALDISGSMRNYYPNKIQDVLNSLAAVAFSLDDNEELDTYVFSQEMAKIDNVTKGNLENYINKEVINTPQDFFWCGTSYSPFMQEIVDDFFLSETKTKASGGFFGMFKKDEVIKEYSKQSKDNFPVYVIILTDGACDDPNHTEAIIEKFKDSNIYWQFIGISKNEKEFSLIKEWGDRYNNVGFFNFSSLDSMSEDELFDALVSTEFADFIKKD